VDIIDTLKVVYYLILCKLFFVNATKSMQVMQKKRKKQVFLALHNFCVIKLGYGLDDQGFKSWQGLGIFTSPLCPDKLWGPPSLLSKGTRGSFSGGKEAGE
jgi:hypothetical protein